MKVPLGWLSEFVKIDIPPERIARRLVEGGVEVEGIEEVGKFARDYKVVKVVSAGKKPGIKLTICEIWDGRSKYTVLTGAPVKEGGKYVWCPPGTKVFKGDSVVEIGVKQVRDIKSYGMLLSPAEIGYGADEDKLLELPGYVEEGSNAGEVLGLPDTVLDVSITPQRGDLLSVVGVAREISALTGAPFTEIYDDLHTVKTPQSSDVIELRVEEPELCPYYIGTLFEGELRHDVSDPRIISRLYLCGARPISPVVDATNYVLFLIGQPTHAFDRDLLDGIVVRRARAGEKLLCLDGKERELDSDVLVIADTQKPVAIAGVIGGEETGVSLKTRRILLESAWFKPEQVRRSAKKLGVETESSYRFARRVSPLGVSKAVELISNILQKHGYRKVASAVFFASEKFQPKKIKVSVSFVSEYTGMSVTPDEARNILTSLGCKVEVEGDSITVTPPLTRGDIAIEEDIVEEIARVKGYDKIGRTFPTVPMMYFESEEERSARERIFRIKQIVSGMGFDEVITYSFDDKGHIKILNPIAVHMGFLRSSLLSGMCEAGAQAIKKGLESVRIFEVGKIFLPDETLALGVLVSGSAYPQTWHFPQKSSDIFDVKEVFDRIFALADVSFSWQEHEDERFDWCFRAVSNSRTLGYLGKVSVEFAERFEVKKDFWFGEIFLDTLPPLREGNFVGKFVSDFPLISRDISFFPEKVPVERVREIVTSSKFDDIEVVDAWVFDVWKGEEGKVSVAMRILFRTRRTFSAQELTDVLFEIIRRIEREGVKVRKPDEEK